MLGPVKALYSMKYYVSRMNKSGWKALWFSLYLFLITAVCIVLITYISGKPVANGIIDKFAYYTPVIQVQNGTITVNNNQTLLIEPKELNGYNIVFDTGRTEPVYPTQLAQANTLFLITGKTIYFNYQDRFQATDVPANANVLITPQIILQNKDNIGNIVLYTLIGIMVVAQLLKIPFMIAIAFLTAAIINGFIHSSVSAGKLLKLACYVQAPVTLIYILNYASPFKIPFVIILYVIIFGIYSQMAIARYRPEEEAAQPLEMKPEEPAEDKPEAKPENGENAQEESPLPEDKEDSNDTEDKK